MSWRSAESSIVDENRICPHCSAWLCRGDDAWCGYCGEGCAQLALVVQPSVLHLGQRPPRLFCKITNLTCAELSDLRPTMPEWIRFELDKLPPLKPGASLTFFLEAVTEQMRGPAAGVVAFAAQAGGASARVTAIEESPALICSPSRLVAWAGTQARKNPIAVTVTPAASELCLTEIRMVGVEGTASAQGLGRVVGKDSSLPVTLHLDAGSVLAEKGGRLIFGYEGPHGAASAQASFTVAVRRPPQLRWAGVNRRPEVRHQTVRQILEFEFHNQDPAGKDGGAQNADLVLEAIQLVAPAGRAIAVKLMTDLPATVPGGASFTAQFHLDLSALEGEPAQQLEFTLIVGTNLPALNVPVFVTVEPVLAYSGVVAIDFGTSNTCCAVWREGEEPRLVAIDEDAAQISPTVVRYLSLATSPATIATGSRVKADASEFEEVAAAVADRLKQRLGDRRQEIDIRPTGTGQWSTRKASEAAADYLRSVRQLAEAENGAVFRDFILTHPARCSLKQFERLRAALLTAFGAGGNRVSFLQEPIAALIPFIADRAVLGAHGSYRVASFDLGGGTTDIALIEVQCAQMSADRLEVTPRILYCRGVRFGGEDLTDFVAASLAQRCQEILVLEGTGATLIAENMRAAAALDARRNQAALREAAERFKASISQEDGAIAAPANLLLRVMQQDGLTATFDFEFARLLRLGGRELRDEFLAYTREQVREKAGLLRRAIDAREGRLDVIQLSGKTAYLSAVGEVLAEMFPGVAIERAPDPKECVVLGACLSRALRRGRLTLNLPGGAQRMTSTIGAFGLDSPWFVPIFSVDEEVPPEGLTRELPGFWDGVEALVLWEDLDDAAHRVEYATAAKSLTRLGSWEPRESLALRPRSKWTLRVTLREFSLAVSAVGPNGESHPFRPILGSGE